MERVTQRKAALTAEEFLALAEDERDVELWDGAVVVRDPAGFYASVVNATLVHRIAEFVSRGGLGHITESSAGYVVRRGPDRVLAPDVGFIAKGREISPRGYFEGVPDFVVEVRSPSGSWEGTLARGGLWLAEGVRLVWLVDSLEPRAVELRPDERPVLVGPDGILRGEPVLRGLEVPLSVLGIRTA